MTDDAGRVSDKYEARLNQAVADLRHNVRWTLIAFGAIGTTLLAGSQLSSLGRFQWDDARLWVALGSALIALLAAAWAVRATLAVVFAGYTELYNLSDEDTEYVNENPAMLEGFESVDGLRTAYDQCIKERHAELTAAQKNPQAIDHYEIWFGYLDALVDRVLSYIRYNRIRQQSATSGLQLFFASIIAAIALVIFAWAANPGKDQRKTMLAGPPFAAALTLTDVGKSAFSEPLGSQCVALPKLPVIVLGTSKGKYDVVTQGSTACPIVMLVIDDSLGSLVLKSN